MNYNTCDQESCSHSPCTSNKNKELFAGIVSAHTELQLKYLKRQPDTLQIYIRKKNKNAANTPENTALLLGSEGECHSTPICR